MRSHYWYQFGLKIVGCFNDEFSFFDENIG